MNISAEDTKELSKLFSQIQKEIKKVIIGYDDIIQNLLIALFANRHVLLEGVPGLGKTKLVLSFSKALGLRFSRIQFTPDLMPADILGTNLIVEKPDSKQFEFQKGPIFANIILADEINRASPKTQAALLECMQEKKITMGGKTYKLEEPFMVLATQNPIDMEGTYPLPEAQLDRFFFKLIANYPSTEQLKKILNLTTTNAQQSICKISEELNFTKWQTLIRDVYIAPNILDYVINIIMATHPNHSKIEETKQYVQYGASPRGAQSLVFAAKIQALLNERYNVSLEDIKKFAKASLRHRLILNFQAEAKGIRSDTIIEAIVQKIPFN